MEVELTPDLQAKLARLAAEQGRETQALVREAVERFVDYDEWFLREVERGLAAAEHGDLVEHHEHRRTHQPPIPRLMRIRWTELSARDLTNICDYTEQLNGRRQLDA